METTVTRRRVAPVTYKEYSVKEVSLTGRKVSGYLAVFGVKDSDSDILIKGCFAKSINERGPGSTTNRKIAFLWQHDMKNPIGRFTELKEDNIGLYFEAEIDEIEQGDRAIAQMKSGTLNQFSIGFSYVWDRCEWDEDAAALIVKEVNLYEGSVVTMGANEYTFFAGMKSEQKQQAEYALIEETEVAIKCLPKEQQYTIRQLITKHIALASSKPGQKIPLPTGDAPPESETVLADMLKEVRFFPERPQFFNQSKK